MIRGVIAHLQFSLQRDKFAFSNAATFGMIQARMPSKMAMHWRWNKWFGEED